LSSTIRGFICDSRAALLSEPFLSSNGMLLKPRPCPEAFWKVAQSPPLPASCVNCHLLTPPTKVHIRSRLGTCTRRKPSETPWWPYEGVLLFQDGMLSERKTFFLCSLFAVASLLRPLINADLCFIALISNPGYFPGWPHLSFTCFSVCFNSIFYSCRNIHLRLTKPPTHAREAP
jgi:hypothetical protein